MIRITEAADFGTFYRNETAHTFEKYFFKLAIPGLFFIYFHLFKQTSQFLHQTNVENVHPVYGAWFWNHNLRNMVLP